MTTAVLEAPATAPSYGLLTDLDEIAERCAAIANEKLPFGFDVETGYHGEPREGAALHPEENFIVSFQFTNSLAWARDIPLAHDTGPNVDNKAVAALLWPLLHAVDDEGLPLGVAWGAVAELRWLSRWFLRLLWDHPLFGRQVRDAHGYYPVRSCALLESFSEGENKSHALKAATLDNYGHQMRELTDLQASLLGRPPTDFEKNSVRFNVFDASDPEVIAYACEDAVYALRHHLDRWPKVRRTFIYRVEMGVLPIVCDMADVGIEYDWALLRAKAAECKEFEERLLAEVIEDFEALAGEKLPVNFNLNSSKQFGDLLYVKCKMPVLHWTDGGKTGKKNPSVDAKKALPGLAIQYAEVRKYLTWKRLHDLRLKFLEIYEDKYSWAADGRAHPMLVQHGTITGRTSSESPNVQQSPGKYHVELRDGTVFEFNFRDAIVATGPGRRPWWELVLEEAGCTDLPPVNETGYYIIGFDYSQIELRVLAAEAGETELLEAFRRGEDVHRLTASKMLGKPLHEVTKEERQDKGKRMNFAIGYGLSEHGMHLQTGKPIEECRELFAAFHAAYPRLKPFTREVIRRARRFGYVITKFGRKVRIWEFDNPSRKVQAAGERTAGNCVIQGPATGEYVKVAMIRAQKALEKAGLAARGVRPIMNIHDALEWEAPRDIPPAEIIAALKDAVIYPITGPGVAWPPLEVDWHMGLSWGKLMELEVLPDGTVRRKKDADPKPEPAPDPGELPDEAFTDAAPAAAVPVVREPVTPPVPAPPPGPPRKVIIVLRESPTRGQVAALAEFLKSLPGGNSVELQVPDGAFPVKFACGLMPEHEARISVICGAAAVHYALDSVDAASMTDGLEL